MRRWAASSISSADRCAAPVTTTREGTTRKCYLSPEYNVLPITWTVQLTDACPWRLQCTETDLPGRLSHRKPSQSDVDCPTLRIGRGRGSHHRSLQPSRNNGHRGTNTD